MTATVTVLFEGYVGDHTASTVALIQDGEVSVVVDPGMVPAPSSILRPLGEAGVDPGDVADVILSHHHPDHTMNAGLFPGARVHDHWAIYQGDLWTDRAAEGHRVSPSVTLIETPGHTPQDISTLVETGDGLVVFTHLWWSAGGPPEDPRATDPVAFHRGRERVLALEGLRLLVPGHGAAFAPGPDTPR
jgi:glyoxylase-like metal-dependent hydrolase (beta-lactamase superfamily II)